jgi:hypothetical protein
MACNYGDGNYGGGLLITGEQGRSTMGAALL